MKITTALLMVLASSVVAACAAEKGSVGLLSPTLSSRGGEGAGRVYKVLAFTEFFRRTNGWVSGDGAISVPLSDGRVLWLFGDSHLDDYDAKTGTTACLFQCRNAGLLQASETDLKTARTLRTTKPIFKSWFKNSTNENLWFWPMCGFQNKDAVYIYLSALKKTGEGMWGFGSAGNEFWGKVAFPSMEVVDYVPLPAFDGVQMGQGFVEDGNWIYAFGSKARGVGSDVVVARFKSGEPIRWGFWNGTDWNGASTNAAAVGRANVGVHVCLVRGKYVLTTGTLSIAADGGRDIFMATSDKPTGPFSELTKVWTVDDTYRGHIPFWYIPQAHPEFINKGGEILVTYSINGYEPAVKACVDGRAIPDHYRPKAIRVPLRMIGIK
ncbi:MAG: hypothetical protein JWO95_1428 [Verrucomicrobiales bacterium]|nr:hypothetical protein [Verrucomicrobiales bacterium]